ncbi:hypothetical protein ACFC57_01585 [Enterococcus hirae]|uniref:hypothetical protein n=1 Tax=Enterococcus hirae TaxID=1354 RepID=UPI0019DD73A8|nr:hypothetical protein [Enterococcus hirae]EMF0208363.1 hypothetical protein [Enterococcus hirae]EMF0225568.1 hypothetical protein [Enterococcus hirae]
MIKDIEKAREKYVKNEQKYIAEMSHVFNQKWNWTSNMLDNEAGVKYDNLIEYMYLYKKVVEKNPEQFTENGRERKNLINSLNSLNGSIGCSYDNKYFKPCMKDLVNNDPDSFLVIPIMYNRRTGDVHSVSLLIQKEDNKIKVRVCNKGGQLVPNEAPNVDGKISLEHLNKIASFYQWENWNDFSDKEKLDLWKGVSKEDKAECVESFAAVEKLWVDLDTKQLKSIYVYEFEESKENIEAISKAVRIGRYAPTWRDFLSLSRKEGVSFGSFFQDKYMLFFHKTTEFPLKELHHHASECKFENYVARSQMTGACIVKNIGLAFKYTLGYKTKAIIKDKEYDQCKQIEGMDEMLLKVAKDEVKNQSYSDLLDQNYAFFLKNKKELAQETPSMKIVKKELLIDVVNEAGEKVGDVLTNQFLINQKDVKNELHNRKTGEEYLRKVAAVNKKVSKKKKAERLNSGLER